VLVVVVVVVLAVLAVAAYRVLGLGSAAPPDPRVLMQRAADKLQASRSFRFGYSVDYGASPPAGSALIVQSASGDFVRPSSLAAQVAIIQGGAAVSTQIIEVGGKTYLQNPLTNQWGTVQGGFDPSTIFDPSGGVKRLLAEMRSVTAAGEDTVAGRPAWHIKATVPDASLSLLVGSTPRAGSVPVDAWIDKADGTIAQLKANGALTADEPAATVRTLTLSGYDKTYDIKAPALH
jgi:hypothetical protein